MLLKAISPRTRLRWLITIIVICAGLAATVLAGMLTGVVSSSDVVPIEKILDNPQTFHMQLVQLQGTVRDIEILKPHDPYQPGDPCFGAYLFSLDDKTGTLRIGVQGHRMNCGVAIGEERPEIHEGDHVRVEARIHAPGVYVDKLTAPWPVHKTATQAIAVRINPFGE